MWISNPAATDLFAGGLAWAVVGALWSWCLALLLGASILPRAWPEESDGRLLTWAVLGFAAQTQVWLLIGLFGGLGPRSVIIGAGLLTLLGLGLSGRRLIVALYQSLSALRIDDGEPPRVDSNWLLLAAASALGLFFLLTLRLAVWPTVFYDDLVYHVAAPRQALLVGSWPAQPGMHYSYMPAGWDAAYLLPMALGAGSGPQLMNVICLVVWAWAIYRLCRRAAGPGVAAATTALLVIAPMNLSLGAFAGNDLFVGLALTVALERLLASRGERPLTIGLLTGAAWAAKYTALPGCAAIGLAAAVISPGSIHRRLSRTAVVGVVTLLVAAAWTVRSWILTGNPIYPAFYGLFGGAYWNPQSASVVAETVSHGGLANRGPLAFVLALWDLIAHSDTLGFPSGIQPLFPVLALVGLSCSRRIRHGTGLLVVAGVAYLGWCTTSLNLRYGLVLLAAMAPFAAAPIQWLMDRHLTPSRRRVANPLLVGLLLILLVGPLSRGVERHLGYYGPGTPLWGGTPRSEMQVTRLHLAAAGREMAARLDAGSRLLLIGDGRIGLLPRPAEASSAYDHPDIARYVAGAQTVAEINGRLAGFTHVVVNYRELKRFEDKLHFTERFGPGEWELFHRWLDKGLTPIARYGAVVVYRLPRDAAAETSALVLNRVRPGDSR